MKHTNKYRALPALLLAALLLIACSQGTPSARQNEPVAYEAAQITAEPAETAAAQPTKKAAPEPTAEPLPEGTVEVGTVDELLAALAPNTTILLKEGEYDLTTAADYGDEGLRGCYSWELVLGGAQLNITGLRGLRLVGQGQVSIVTRPRYADVIRFADCWDLTLEGLTLGHTKAPGGCIGDVLHLDACDGVCLENCRLYGCGVLGVSAMGCESVTLRNCRIDSCSSGAVYASGCRDMRLEDCSVSDCGLGQEGAGGSLFLLDQCKGFALVNCEISGNRVQELVQNYWSEQVSLLGCRVEQNHFLNAVFVLMGRGVTVDKCAFRLRGSERYYAQGGSVMARTPEGKDLTQGDLDAMAQERAEYAGPAAQTVSEPERTQQPDGTYEVHVSTAEELIAAIAPNTTVYLKAGVYDLSGVADCGGPGGDWYGWDSDYDGYTLKIVGVSGLKLVGAGKGETVLTATPRYAAVLRFQSCDDLTLSGITAGHSEGPGYCSGNVLDFFGCWNVTLEGCGLYGCGVLGIWAMDSSGMAVRGCEIYECSSGAADFSGCTGVSFEGCSIHDCEYNQICLYGCEMTWDGQLLSSGTHAFQDTAYLGEVQYN